MKKHSILSAAVLLLLCTMILPAVPIEYTGEALKRNLKISRATVQSSADVLAVKTFDANKSAIYQEKLNWQTDGIKQIIVTLKADKPGQLRFSCNTFADGKRLSNNVYLPVVSDGEFHDYIFDMAGKKNWRGVLTNYELRWFGAADTLLEVKKFATSDKTTVKLIGNALKGKVLLFKAKAVNSSHELAAQTTGTYGGFHQQKLSWKADEINTVSFTLKSDKPGTLRYACSLKNAPVTSIALPVQKVPGDNQYRVYTFNLASNPNFAGIQTNYELRFTGEKGAILALKELNAGKTELQKNQSASATAESYVLKTSSSAGADGIVKCGEKVSLKVQAFRNGKPITDKDLFLAVKCFSDGEGSKEFKAPVDKEFEWCFTRKQPGRAYISCRIKSQKQPNTVIKVRNPRNSQDFLSEHGIGIFAEPDKQRIQRQEPADFDNFWTEKKLELAKVPLKVLEKVPFHVEGNTLFEVYDVKLACAGPVPVSGIISIPKDKSRKYPAMVQYHGAGVRSANAYIQPGAITFNVNAHGLPNGKDKSFYDAITYDPKRNPYKQSAEKRFEMFQYMFLRAVRAVEYMRTLPEWNGKDLIVTGGSQGGVQSIAAAALDKSVTLAVPGIPAMIGLAEFTISKNVESAWPNPYTKEFYSKKDITAIAKKFDYVDGAFLLRRVTCPIHVSIGLYDWIAAHVFAAFNDCPAREKSITSVPDMGHYNYNPRGRSEIKAVIEK